MTEILEQYRAVELQLDLANQYVPNTIVTSGLDARGRNLNLTITNAGTEADLEDSIVWLAWHHNDVGNSGIRKFTEVDASKGKYTCNFPVNMAHLGTATCSVIVTDDGPTFFLPSLEFTITIQSAIFDGQEADTDDDFSDLQEAMGNLKTVLNEAVSQLEDQSGLFDAAMAKWDADYEASEDARDQAYQTAEAARENAYEAAEAARNSAYQTAEGARDDLYEEAEAAREQESDAAVAAANSAATAANQAAQNVQDALEGDLDPLFSDYLDSKKDVAGGFVSYENRVVADGVTIENNNNVIGLKDSGIQSQHLDQGAVTTNAIADANVTEPKMADGSVSTRAIADLADLRGEMGLGDTLGALPVGCGGTGSTNIADAVYPVGSIYMSVNSTNPSTLFGGTWTQLMDVFLLACGNNYSAGSTGGEAEHALTTNETPNHMHYYSGSDKPMSGGSLMPYIVKGTSSSLVNMTVNYSGSGGAHNNMPPYLAVYAWKRTA